MKLTSDYYKRIVRQAKKQAKNGVNLISPEKPLDPIVAYSVMCVTDFFRALCPDEHRFYYDNN